MPSKTCVPSSHNWLFTWNNPVGLITWYGEVPLLRYLIYSEEIGENGTYHYQGYLQLAKDQKLSWLKKNLSPEPHFQIPNSSPQDNIAYCSKDNVTHIDGPYIYGTPVFKGQRSDLLTIKTKLDTGATDKQIANEHFVESCVLCFLQLLGG